MHLLSELLFLGVFFAPMAAIVAMNLLLRNDPPDVAAPWIRLAAHACAERGPEPVRAASVPASNDDELEQAA
jgi:hypothetical protein